MSSFFHAQSGKTIYVGGGIPGRSAYEEAVAAGFAGTAAEWLAAQKGERGDPGTPGDPGPRGPKGDPGEPGPVTRALPILPLSPPRILRAADTLMVQPIVWPEGVTATVVGYAWLRDGAVIDWAAGPSYTRTIDDDAGVAVSAIVTVDIDGARTGLHTNAIFFAPPPVIVGGGATPPDIEIPPRIEVEPNGVYRIVPGVWSGVPTPEVTGYLFLGPLDQTQALDDTMRWTAPAGASGLLLWIETGASIAGTATTRVSHLIAAAPPPQVWDVAVDDGEILITSMPAAPAGPGAPTAHVAGADIIITE